MSKRSVPCPRCKATGKIRQVQTFYEIEDGERVQHRKVIECDCQRCRGTGTASLLDKMGAKREEHREDG